MTKNKLVISILISLFITTNTQAQLGGLLKKKKNKEEKTEVVTNDSIPQTEEEKPEKKKKGGGLMQKVISKVTKGAGNVIGGVSGITAIGDLAEADIIVTMGTNIYSKDLGLAVHDFLGKEWVNNGDFTMLQLASQNRFQFYKYDGIIKVNGKELKHSSMGVHSATEAPGVTSKKITLEKDGTVEGSFEIPMPVSKIKLISIDGQKSNVKVDFTKDVVLEIANYSNGPDALIRVDIVGTIIGMRSLYTVCYVKPAARIVIPAAAFRNIETSNKIKFKDSYLTISDQQQVTALNTTGKIPKNQSVIIGSNDGMWVEVTKSVDINEGFTINSGNAKIVKGNVPASMPLSYAKNIAISSFYTYGETYTSGTKEEKLTNTRTTKTIDFPEVPDEVLQEAMSVLHGNITNVIKNVLGAKVMPTSTVKNAPGYANTEKFMKDDLNNSTAFLKSLDGLGPIKSFTTVANRYYGENALLNDTKADALLKVSLILQLSWDNKPMMTPNLHVELVGKPYGDFRSFVGSTKYFTVDIKGDGYEINNKTKFIKGEEIFQVSNLSKQLKTALDALKTKEATMGDYEAIWNLQK